MEKNLTLKTRQTNSDFPPEFLRPYQAVVNVFKHYSIPFYNRPAIPNDDYFFRNVHKMPEFHGVQGAKGTEEQGFESTPWWSPPHLHNSAKVPTSRFSIVDSWTNVKKLLKRKI